MSREVRRVTKDWKHPSEGHYADGKPRYHPMHEGYAEAAASFLKRVEEKGLQDAVDYCGGAPNRDDYMPEWPEAERTHLMMYETCSQLLGRGEGRGDRRSLWRGGRPTTAPAPSVA